MRFKLYFAIASVIVIGMVNSYYGALPATTTAATVAAISLKRKLNDKASAVQPGVENDRNVRPKIDFSRVLIKPIRSLIVEYADEAIWELKQVISAPRVVPSLSLSPDDKEIAFCSGYDVFRYDIDSTSHVKLKEKETSKYIPVGVQYSGDGLKLLVGYNNESVIKRDLKNNTNHRCKSGCFGIIVCSQDASNIKYERGSEEFAVSPDGKHLLCLNTTNEVDRFFLKSNGKQKDFKCSNEKIKCFGFSPDSEKFFVGYEDGYINQYSVNDDGIEKTIEGCANMTWGYFVTNSWLLVVHDRRDNTFIRINLKTGQTEPILAIRLNYIPQRINFSATSSLIALADNKEIKIWKYNKNKRLSRKLITMFLNSKLEWS